MAGRRKGEKTASLQALSVPPPPSARKTYPTLYITGFHAVSMKRQIQEHKIGNIIARTKTRINPVVGPHLIVNIDTNIGRKLEPVINQLMAKTESKLNYVGNLHGIFDGQGHTIYGFSATTSLFNIVDEGAILRNLNMVNTHVSSVSAGAFSNFSRRRTSWARG